jgi:molybdenum cofactor cytidylyltransferase
MTSAGIILAAGAGRRFGGAKQLALYEGEPLVRRASRVALEAGLSPVIVVLGAHADAVRAALTDLPVHAVVNDAWADGMGGSLACGVRALDAGLISSADPTRSGDGTAGAPSIADVAVLLADQPLVTANHLRALVAARRDAGVDIAATDTGAALGVPAVFARALVPALAALMGDRGAREVIATHERRVALAFADAAFDVDTPVDVR